MNYWIRAILYWLGRYVQLQLFVTLVSLPLLSAWGLPISVLSILGNFLFGYALIAFLFFSSIIFFCELFWVPNGWFIWALERISSWWMTIMGYADQRYLLPIEKPSDVWLLLIPAIALFLIWYRPFRPLGKSIIVLSTFFMLMSFLLYFSASHSSGFCVVERANSSILLVYTAKKTVIIDSGCSGPGRASRSWVEYTLIPRLMQIGRASIDDYIVLKPNGVVFEQVALLCDKIPISRVHVIAWSGKLPFKLWQKFVTLRSCIVAHGGQMKRIGAHRSVLIDEAKASLVLEVNRLRTVGSFQYPTVTVSGMCNGISIENIAT